jgi:hypothetical protein
MIVVGWNPGRAIPEASAGAFLPGKEIPGRGFLFCSPSKLLIFELRMKGVVETLRSLV